MNRRSQYAPFIEQTLAIKGRTDLDPRHIEAWIRVEHSTLDWISCERFDSEVEIAIDCCEQAGQRDSERLAVSYRL